MNFYILNQMQPLIYGHPKDELLRIKLLFGLRLPQPPYFISYGQAILVFFKIPQYPGKIRIVLLYLKHSLHDQRICLLKSKNLVDLILEMNIQSMQTTHFLLPNPKLRRSSFVSIIVLKEISKLKNEYHKFLRNKACVIIYFFKSACFMR